MLLQGPITAVRWRGGLVAWVNSKGVKVVDIETYQKAARSRQKWHKRPLALVLWLRLLLRSPTLRGRARAAFAG